MYESYTELRPLMLSIAFRMLGSASESETERTQRAGEQVHLIETRGYQVAARIVDLFLLNLLWITSSLGVITMFPATVALFGVAKGWVLGREPRLVEDFVAHFRSHFWSSIALGLPWTLLGGAIAFNLTLAPRLPGGEALVVAWFPYSLALLASPVAVT